MLGEKSAHCFYNLFVILVPVRLKKWSVGIEIPDVLVAFVADGANTVEGFIAPVTRGKDVFSGFVLGAKERAALHVLGDGDAGEVERCGGDVDMADKVVTDGCRFDGAGPAHYEGDVYSFIVEKLFASGVADSMVGPQDNDGPIGNIFSFETV